MTESRSTFKLYVSHKFFKSIFAFSKFFPNTTSPSKPKTIFSRTVKFSTSIKCWCTIPMPFSIESLGDFNLITLSFTFIVPESA